MLQTNRLRLHVLTLTLATAASSVSFAQNTIQLRLDSVALVGSPPVSQIEERTYDLSEAIAAYVIDSELSADEARKEALTQLFAPIGNDPIRREEIEPGKFRVSATATFHEFLPGVVEWMKNDQKQICIEVRIVTVTESTRRVLHDKFSDQWEMSVCRNADTAIMQTGMPSELTTHRRRGSSTGGVISSTTYTAKSWPSRVARLTADQAKAVVEAQQADTRHNVLQAPKVTVFPGQEAIVKDTAQRPFVIGVIPIKGDLATALQPVIKVLEEGLTIKLRASLQDDDQLDIDSVVTSRKIGDVDSFTFKLDESCEEATTIQLPEENVGQVHVSMVVEDGATLLIDPHFVKEEATKKRWGRQVTTRHYTMLMLTPSVIHQRPRIVVDQPSPAPVSHLSTSWLTPPTANVR